MIISPRNLLYFNVRMADSNVLIWPHMNNSSVVEPFYSHSFYSHSHLYLFYLFYDIHLSAWIPDAVDIF